MPTNLVAAKFAEEVRATMGRRQVSQTKLAVAIGMSQPAMNRRLHGKVPFDVVELSAIASFFDVPVSTFLSPEDAIAS